MKDLKELLNEKSFRFEKKFGQNFITDTNLLKAIVLGSGVTLDDTVLEIGAGAGTLTKELAAVAKEVVAYEIDRRLEPVLREVLSGQNNVSLEFDDFMEADLNDLKRYGTLTVVANLPYYITTPVLMKLLESNLSLKSVTVMVQKEVADRLTAKAGMSEYGAITVAIDYAGSAKIIRNVPRTMFYPRPDVDSAVVRIDIENRYHPLDKMLFKKVCRAAFAMRRKTLVNNLTALFPLQKSQAEEILTQINLKPDIRGERLTVADFVTLSDRLYELFN